MDKFRYTEKYKSGYVLKIQKDKTSKKIDFCCFEKNNKRK